MPKRTLNEEEPESELTVEGLIDASASEGSEEERSDEEESDLDELIGSEEDISANSSDFEEPEDDSKSITDKIAQVQLFQPETKFADGSVRILKPEIDPVYDSDDSDGEAHNTIGNVPLSAYEEFPHIGYNINGKRIMRPAKGSALDQLLESIDLPEGWTGLLDQETGSSLKLSEEELELIRKIQNNEQTQEDTNPYEPTIEWFTSKTEVMPLSAAPEPKRRFVPSKHEARRVMKIVKAIREGRIVPPGKAKEEEVVQPLYDLWGDSQAEDHIMTLRAPKLAPPTNEQSYNPPEEYLLTEEERKEWESKDPSERESDFIPKKYASLRRVPGYSESIRERFERSLDLYLAPRVRHNKLQIDPDSLIPDLPSPKDLRPFPIKCSTVFEGHTGKVRSVSVDVSGLWLATGGDDGFVRVWEILTGRQVYSIKVDDEPVETVEWNPIEQGLLAVASESNIYLVVPPIFGFPVENAAKLKIESGYSYDEGEKKDIAQWSKPTPSQVENGISLVISTKKSIKELSWHRKGDYFVSVSPEGANRSVSIHQLSKHVSQSPFRKSKGIIMDAKFHPFKPQLFVASQRYVRIYDLQAQTMIKKLMPGARWLSGIDIHPRGDNLLASSYDKRVLWHDLDLSSTPYKTLRYHDRAVRSVSFHKGNLPLFCSASDDGSVHVFHGTVYDDLMSNPLLVPLKKLTGHKTVNSLGVLDTVWHPKEAWLFTAGADGTARLWTS